MNWECEYIKVMFENRDAGIVSRGRNGDAGTYGVGVLFVAGGDRVPRIKISPILKNGNEQIGDVTMPLAEFWSLVKAMRDAGLEGERYE